MSLAFMKGANTMTVYVNPFRQLRREMDRLPTGFFPTTFDEFLPGFVRGQPAVNIWDQGEELMVEMEVPGVKSNQIDISVTGAELTVKVERPDLTQEDVIYHRRERPTGIFTRVLQLPCAVDAQRVQADLHEGVLNLSLPKAETAKPRKINVATA